MIVKRQKLFFIGTALTGAMLLQGGMQMKQSSQQAEEQEEQNRQQIKAMNKIAKAAEKNPQATQDFLAVKQMSAVNGKTLSNAKGFLKDMKKFAWGKRDDIARDLVMGAGIGVTAYGANKFVQSQLKKDGIDITKQKSISQKQFSGSIMSRGAKFGKRAVMSTVKSPMSLGMIGVFGALPVISDYAADKSQMKDQVKYTGNIKSTQKQFAKIPTQGLMSKIKNTGRWVKKGFKQLADNPTQKITDVTTGIFGGGRHGRLKLTEDFNKLANESGNSWTKSTANFLKNHQKTAAVGAGAVGFGTMTLGFDGGEKLTKKAIKSVDKNAYAYQESKEQVPQ